ncbi:hypothetical protein [Halolamina sp.]|uniref:hypothetical protein n=1 Tax=Halolamina sp. TaxID=1940283 RepID=UPI003564F72A
MFGAVLTTVFGALHQLVTMFTQTARHGVDHRLQRIEERWYPLGVLLLDAGQLLGASTIATVGGLLFWRESGRSPASSCGGSSSPVSRARP